MDYITSLLPRALSNAFLASFLLFFFVSVQANAVDTPDIRSQVEQIEHFVNTGKLDSARLILDIIEEGIADASDHDALSRYHFGLGIYLSQTDNLDSAITHLDLAVENAQKVEKIDSVLLAKVHGNLFGPQEITGNRELANENIRKAVSIAEAIGPGKIKDTGTYYRKLAVSHLFTGDLDKAKYFLTKSEQYYDTYDPMNAAEKIAVGGTLAFTLVQAGETEEASKKYHALLDYSEKMQLPEHSNLSLLVGLAICLRQNKEYNQALDIVDKSEAITVKYLGPKHRALGDIWNIKGNVLMELKRYKEADTFIRKSLENRISVVGEKSFFCAQQYWTLGDIKLKQGDSKNAIEDFKKAISAIEYRFNDPSYFLLKRNYNAVTNALTFLNKGFIEEYMKSENPEDLNESIRLAKESVFALDQMRSNFNSLGSKEYLIQEAYTIYENAIHSKFLEFEHSGNSEALKQALEYMERSKMQTLQENARESGYTYENKIPDETISARNMARTQLQQTIETMDASEEKDPVLEKQYLEYTDALNSIQKTIREDYASHSNYIEEVIDLDMDALQQTVLNDSTIVLEYFLGDDYLFRFCIGDSDMKLHRQKLPKNFTERVKNFRLHTSSYNTKAAALLIDSLSEILLKDLPCLTGNNVKHIKIIPDEYLWYIPFEVLHKENEQSPLLTDYTISYANSLKLLLYQNKISHNANGKILAFVPEYKDMEESEEDNFVIRSSLGALHGTKKEVKNILEFLPVNSFFGSKATKSNFQKHASSFEVLHLAMHTMPDSKDNPSLVFNQNEGSAYEKLSFAELSGMEINSNLAVISACKSGVGKIHRGTGIESISQAFTYAGVPSTVMSLWSVPDESTSKIMINFYKHLSNGVNKADALRNAKLDYLKDDSVPPSQKTYNYWAGFIVEGNLQNIEFSSFKWNRKYAYFLLGILSFCGIVLYDKRKKK